MWQILYQQMSWTLPNVTSTLPITSDDKKVINKIDCFFAYLFLSDHITIHNYYYYTKQRTKQNRIDTITILK